MVYSLLFRTRNGEGGKGRGEEGKGSAEEETNNGFHGGKMEWNGWDREEEKESFGELRRGEWEHMEGGKGEGEGWGCGLEGIV